MGEIINIQPTGFKNIETKSSSTNLKVEFASLAISDDNKFTAKKATCSCQSSEFPSSSAAASTSSVKVGKWQRQCYPTSKWGSVRSKRHMGKIAKGSGVAQKLKPLAVFELMMEEMNGNGTSRLKDAFMVIRLLQYKYPEHMQDVQHSVKSYVDDSETVSYRSVPDDIGC